MLMVDLVRLSYAVAIAEEGSYALASLRLGISQPALSRSIQMLEKEYRLQLFTRGRAGAKLTAQGVEFLKLAQRLVNRAGSVDEQLRLVSSGGTMPVAIGIGPISAATVMPELLTELVATGVKLRIRIESLATLQLLLRHEEIDFFISGLPVSDRLSRLPDDFRLKRIPLTSVNLFVREGHPLLDRAIVPEDIQCYPVGSASFLRELLSPARLARYGIQSPSVEVDDYMMLSALARTSDFIIVAVRGLADARPEFGLTPLPLDVTVDDIEFGLVSTGFNDLSAEARRIANMLLDGLAKQMTRAGLVTPSKSDSNGR